jgi:sugar/nucleoside kinase (ribokinase family)
MDMQIPAGDIDLLAVGEALIDFISVERVDSLAKAYQFEKRRGGSPANIAVDMAKLGGKTAIAARVGEDTFGDFIRREMDKAGVNTDYLISDSTAATSLVFVTRTQGTPDFQVLRGADIQLRLEDIPTALIARAKVVHTSTWPLTSEPARSTLVALLQQAKALNKIVSCDPNYSPQLWQDASQGVGMVERMLGYASITKPSLDDANRIFGMDQSPEVIIERFHDMGPRVVVLTMGAKGILVSHEGQIFHVPSHAVNVVDATGAGDAFWAGFLVALIDGHPLDKCTRFAREVAEIKLTTIGDLPQNIDCKLIYERLPDE